MSNALLARYLIRRIVVRSRWSGGSAFNAASFSSPSNDARSQNALNGIDEQRSIRSILIQ
jgi:hypothetical protein